jgi:hypothetical protein
VSADEFKRYVLRCDHGASPVTACPEAFRGQQGEQRARVRQRAARIFGWTHIKSELGPFYDNDYCPRHKPVGS